LPLGELGAEARALLFTQARSANTFTDTPVTEGQLRDIYELFHYAPTQSNTNPMRILFVQSPEARAHWRAYQQLAPNGEWVSLAREFSD